MKFFKSIFALVLVKVAKTIVWILWLSEQSDSESICFSKKKCNMSFYTIDLVLQILRLGKEYWIPKTGGGNRICFSWNQPPGSVHHLSTKILEMIVHQQKKFGFQTPVFPTLSNLQGAQTMDF